MRLKPNTSIWDMGIENSDLSHCSSCPPLPLCFMFIFYHSMNFLKHPHIFWIFLSRTPSNHFPLPGLHQKTENGFLSLHSYLSSVLLQPQHHLLNTQPGLTTFLLNLQHNEHHTGLQNPAKYGPCLLSITNPHPLGYNHIGLPSVP